MKIQINSKIHILLGLVAGVTTSFLQAPSNQFQSTFNSTFLTQHEKLYKPIIIPNLTELLEDSFTSQPYLQKNKIQDKEIVKGIIRTELPRELSNEEKDSEEFKPSENRFSSRYSSKEETVTKAEDREEDKDETVTSITDIPILLERGEPISSKISLPSAPDAKSFKDRSESVDDSEEEKADDYQYPNSSEAKEREESEITSTTNEPYSELRTPTSIRTSPDEHFRNYETSSGVADESDDSEKEEESEEKRSLDDYHNSGSKNYHSIQTPLNQIKYRGPHSYKNGFDSQKTKENTPNSLRLIKHNWPYTKEQLKTELEENEILDDEENEKLESDEWSSKQELRTPKTKIEDERLELAVRKDENRFNRSRIHNYIDDQKQRKLQEQNLGKEEEKDHRSRFYKTLKPYVEDEDEPKYRAKVTKASKKGYLGKTPSVQPTKKPKNIFFNYNPGSDSIPKKFNDSKELTLDFPVHQFLGPVVFDEDNSKVGKSYNVPNSNYITGLEQKEKLDQDNLTNQRFQKAVFLNKDVKYKSFNHVEESEEMYNAILANIQSVFGLRTQPLKMGNGRKTEPEVNLEESSALTWSVPLIKRQIKPRQAVIESAILTGSDDKVKSGSEGTAQDRKFVFPTDITRSLSE